MTRLTASSDLEFGVLAFVGMRMLCRWSDEFWESPQTRFELGHALGERRDPRNARLIACASRECRINSSVFPGDMPKMLPKSVLAQEALF
jgi:hypothetical protein